MAIDFSAFDEKVDLQELQNEVQNAPDNDFADRYLSGILSVGQHGTDSVFCFRQQKKLPECH